MKKRNTLSELYVKSLILMYENDFENILKYTSINEFVQLSLEGLTSKLKQ